MGTSLEIKDFSQMVFVANLVGMYPTIYVYVIVPTRFPLSAGTLRAFLCKLQEENDLMFKL
jgi:hypothetical protein